MGKLTWGCQLLCHSTVRQRDSPAADHANSMQAYNDTSAKAVAASFLDCLPYAGLVCTGFAYMHSIVITANQHQYSAPAELHVERS